MRQRDGRNGRIFAPEQDERRAAEHDKDRGAEHDSRQQRNQARHYQFGRRKRRMKPDPNQPGRQREGREPPTPGVRRVPDQPQRNNRKSQRHDQLNRPNRNSVSQDFAAALFGLRQLPGSQTKKYRDARGKSAAEATRETLPATFEESGQGGERQQTAVTRGKHSAEQTDDQDQVL